MSLSRFVPYARLEEALRASQMRADSLAAACGVTRSTLIAWRQAGTIPTRRLPELIRTTGQPLRWWVEGTPYAEQVLRELDGG